jgi:5-methylcytosine-specific restriction protein A
LEVHHKIRLADGGFDTVENAIAVCPNCHRQCHHGRSDG